MPPEQKQAKEFISGSWNSVPAIKHQNADIIRGWCSGKNYEKKKLSNVNTSSPSFDKFESIASSKLYIGNVLIPFINLLVLDDDEKEEEEELGPKRLISRALHKRHIDFP